MADTTQGFNRPDLVSTSSTTAWHSPSAEHLSTQHIDVYVQDYVVDNNCWGKVDNHWLGAACDASHDMVLREKDTDIWMLPLGNFTESGVMLWPAVEDTIRDNLGRGTDLLSFLYTNHTHNVLHVGLSFVGGNRNRVALSCLAMDAFRSG